MAKITTPDSLYGNSRDILREAERENEILADIAGEEYESPGDIPKGKYVIEKRLLDAAQKKNELLESIAGGGGGGGGGAAKAIGIDYATDVISLKNKDGETIADSGATLPAYGVSFDPTTGGLTLTKNGTAVSGQTVTIPNYGSPVGVTSSSDMTDHDTIYLYEGTTSGSYTNGHFYYWDGTAWADGGEYAAATVQTDKTLLVENRAADAKATGEAVGELKTQLSDITGNTPIQFSDPTLKQYIVTNGQTVQWDTPSTSVSTNIKWAVIPCNPGDKFTINGKGGSADRLWAFADSSKNILDPRAGIGATGTNLILTAPSDAAYLILNSEIPSSESYTGELILARLNNFTDRNDLVYDFVLSGAGNQLVSERFKLLTGNTYRFTIVDKGMWSGSAPEIRLLLRTYVDGEQHTIFAAYNPNDEYVFTADSDTAELLIKADSGSAVQINVTDITDISILNNNTVVAFYVDGFSAEYVQNTITVRWASLWIRTRSEAFTLNDEAVFVLSTNSPVVVLRDKELVRLNSYQAVRINDVVIVAFRDNNLSGGLLMPYYYTFRDELDYKDDAQLDIYRKGHQLGLVKWTPKATVKAGEGTHTAGVEVIGIPYSSVKECMKYVGIDVSLHTFMTAVNDIHSLLYTEDPAASTSRSDYDITYHGVNCLCYYGTVCSGFVTTAIGTDVQYNSWEFRSFPELFDWLENQDVRNLQVGDILSENGHCRVISKIWRNDDGSLRFAEMDEQAAPIRFVKYIPRDLSNTAKSVNGTWCRYKYLTNTDYKASPFVLLGDEKLYNVGDYVFIDGVSSRTFYRCNQANSDSEFTASRWSVMPTYQAGVNYTFASYNVAYGDSLYRCIVPHTSTSTFDPTKWERISGIFEWAAYPYIYNDDIVTFAGDRAAFRTNDLIYLNYTKGSYTSLQIYKDGVLLQTLTLPSSGYQIDVSSYCSGAGLYKARLTDGTNYSRYTYFEVIDTNVSMTYQDGYAEIDFSSSNGTPFEVQITEISGYPICHKALSPEEVAQGKVIVNPQAGLYTQRYVYWERFSDNYGGDAYARIMFKGEYGNVTNDMIYVDQLTPITGELVYPDTPKYLGTISDETNIILGYNAVGHVYSFSFTAAENGSINIIPAFGEIKWTENLTSIVEGKTYAVTINNGIGSFVAV